MAKQIARISVLLSTVVQRINRLLRKNRRQMLKKTRGGALRREVGDFYTIDLDRKFIIRTNVDPEQLARKLGVLCSWEEILSVLTKSEARAQESGSSRGSRADARSRRRATALTPPEEGQARVAPTKS